MRKEDFFNEIEARSQGVVGAAREAKGAGFLRMPKGWEKGLEEESSAASGANGEFVVSCLDVFGAEDEFGRTEIGSISNSAGNGGSGFDTREVLAHEARFAALATNVGHAEGLASDKRKAEGGSEHLSSAILAVELDKFHEDKV